MTERLGRHVYFVSYAHRGGFGQCEVGTPNPVDSYSNVLELRDSVRRNSRIDDLIILNFQLLSGPDDSVAEAKEPDGAASSRRFTRLSLSNESDVDKLVNSHVMGHLNVSYAGLVDVLGEPGGNSDPYKQDAEWLLEFPDGTVATVYNYKDGRAYLGDEGKPVEEITDWHVGGHHPDALRLVTELVQNLHPEG